jgi:hypothetical protein
LTTTTSSPLRAAASASRSPSSLVRLYGTAISQPGGWSASVAARPATGPQVAHELVCTTRRTPARAAASSTARVPSTFTACIARACARA